LAFFKILTGEYLHAFDTENPALAEGLILAAIVAAALKRFLAQMTQLLAEVPMPTRKVAMCAMHVLDDPVEALKSEDGAGLYAALEAATTYLACHAQRAHPKREQQTGRLQLGLESFFENDDRISLRRPLKYLPMTCHVTTGIGCAVQTTRKAGDYGAWCDIGCCGNPGCSRRPRTAMAKQSACLCVLCD
jgi:hypothetical protein